MSEQFFPQFIPPWPDWPIFGDVALTKIEEKLGTMQNQLDRIEKLLLEANPQLTK
jgi:hypothetical protein